MLIVFVLVNKPAAYWIGRATNDDEIICTNEMKQNSCARSTLRVLTELVMDDRWVPISRRCAILVDSPLRLWSVILFAIVTMVILAIQVRLYNYYNIPIV